MLDVTLKTRSFPMRRKHIFVVNIHSHSGRAVIFYTNLEILRHPQLYNRGFDFIP